MPNFANFANFAYFLRNLNDNQMIKKLFGIIVRISECKKANKKKQKKIYLKIN